MRLIPHGLMLKKTCKTTQMRKKSLNQKRLFKIKRPLTLLLSQKLNPVISLKRLIKLMVIKIMIKLMAIKIMIKLMVKQIMIKLMVIKIRRKLMVKQIRIKLMVKQIRIRVVFQPLSSLLVSSLFLQPLLVVVSGSRRSQILRMTRKVVKLISESFTRVKSLL